MTDDGRPDGPHINDMSIDELVAFIETTQREISGAGCSRCARGRLTPLLRTARRRLQNLRFEAAKDDDPR